MPSDFALGQSLGPQGAKTRPWEISRSSGDVYSRHCIVYGYSSTSIRYLYLMSLWLEAWPWFLVSWMKLSGCPCSSCTHRAKWDPNESSMKNYIAMIVTNADALMEYTCQNKWTMASWSPRVYHLIIAISPVSTRHWWRKDLVRRCVNSELKEQWDVLGCLFLPPLQRLHPLP